MAFRFSETLLYHTFECLVRQDCLMKERSGSSAGAEHAKVTQSRLAIEEAGISVLLRNPDAGMSEIALAAGIGRATLYRHYDSREVLVQALARKCLDETDVLVQPIKQAGLQGRAAIEATIEVLTPMAARFRFLMSLWVIAAEDKAVNQIYQRQLEELSELVVQAQAAGEIDPDLSVTWVVYLFDAILNNAWLMVESGEMNTDEAALAFSRSFFSGCGVAPAGAGNR